ncbi:MAG TPA: 50S ribosomal protein L29 [Fibrobacteres bacterium]|jgi:large subunit ribosomal protein L29|nr:50S ribosomal protein L29 [Fibrobacterota bacterium]
MAKASEFREMAADALSAKVVEMEAQLFNDRLQAGLGKLENTASLRHLRRDIARAQTALREKKGQAA